MKNTMISIIIAVLCLSLFGCENYTEGDLKADRAFKNMSSKEKIIYEAVQSLWGEKKLLRVREAVRESRSEKPSELSIPFKDLGDVIRTNNVITLKIGTHWTNHSKKKYAAAKWSAVDSQWYEAITGDNDSVDEVDRINKEIKKTEYKENEKKIQKLKKQTKRDDNISNLISLEELTELKYQMNRCKKAKDIFQKIVEEKRPLTFDDHDKIMTEVLICATSKINESLNIE